MLLRRQWRRVYRGDDVLLGLCDNGEGVSESGDGGFGVMMVSDRPLANVRADLIFAFKANIFDPAQCEAVSCGAEVTCSGMTRSPS